MWSWRRRWKSTDGTKVILSLSSGNGTPIMKLCTSDKEQIQLVYQWISRFNQQVDKGIPLVYKY